MNMMAELQRRQMAALGRGFLDDRGPMLVPPPPLPMPGFPDAAGPMAGPPAGDDRARFQDFRGQGGAPQVFRFHFRQGRGLVPDEEDAPPPPPPPRPRRFD